MSFTSSAPFPKTIGGGGCKSARAGVMAENDVAPDLYGMSLHHRHRDMHDISHFSLSP